MTGCYFATTCRLAASHAVGGALVADEGREQWHVGRAGSLLSTAITNLVE
jgi:hypothetical protein